SHRNGVLPIEVDETDAGWDRHVGARLKYTLDDATVGRLIARHGMIAATGAAGSAVFFDANIVHSSTRNVSPDRRAIALITYNSVANVPCLPERSRPAFLVSRTATPIVVNGGDQSQ